jgi:hypothetical protein
MIDDLEHDGTGYEELDWRLQTYAAARLTASPDAVRRMRNAVVTRATDRAAIRAYEEQRRLIEEAKRRRLRNRGLFGWIRATPRRGAGAFLAACLVFGTTAGVAAASPGTPLYVARLWLEAAMLPAQPDDRSAARVDLLEQRVEDAEHAAGGGDPGGVQAALAAYQAEMAQAILDARGDPDRLARLQQAIDVHLLLLQQLENDVPAGAQNALHQAINDSREAQRDIDKAAGKPTPAPTPAPTQQPTPRSQPTPADGGGGGNGGNGGNSSQNGDR